MIASLLKKIFRKEIPTEPQQIAAEPKTETLEHAQRSVQVGDTKIPLPENFGSYYTPSKPSVFYLIDQVIDHKTKKCLYRLQDIKTKKVYKIPADLFLAVFERTH